MSLSTPFSSEDIQFGMFVGAGFLLLGYFRLRNSAERSILMLALAAKLAASVIYGITVYYSYGIGDAQQYHLQGIARAYMIESDIANGTSDYLSIFPLFLPEGGNTEHMVSFTGLVHFLFFNSFIASSFAFAMIAFLGQVLIYRTFVALYPDPRIRVWWRLGILFFPSLTFWTAGLLKDSVALGALGCVVWGIHSLLSRFSWRSLALAAVGAYGLYLFRTPVLAALFVAVVPWLLPGILANKQMAKIGSSGLIRRPIVRVGLAVAVMFGLYSGLERTLGPSVEEWPVIMVSQSLVYEQLSDSSETEVNSPTTIITYDATWAGILAAWPHAVITTLYRPFVWEAGGYGFTMYLAAFENFVLILLSVRVIFIVLGTRLVLASAWRSPLFITCLIFVLIFSLGVGISTANFGTLSRYRAPLIPFLVGALLILEYSYLQRRAEQRQLQPGTLATA